MVVGERGEVRARLLEVAEFRTSGDHHRRGLRWPRVFAVLDASLDAVLLLDIEPDADLADTESVSKLSRQGFVIALTPFVSEGLLEAADLLLPVGTFAETSGTYVNVAGTWQSFGEA